MKNLSEDYVENSRMNSTKVPVYLALFMVVGTALLVLNSSNCINESFSPDISSTRQAGRKLKLLANGFSQGTRMLTDQGSLNLNDYSPIDPVPSSQTSIKPGPIDHGSPIIPYIPEPPPPNQPQFGGGS